MALERIAIDQVRRRRAAADGGIFIMQDGSSPNWAYEQRQDAKTEIKRARLALEEAQSAEQEAERTLAAVRANVLLQSKAAVKAPAGATIRSLIIGAGATVVPGDAVARWNDCNEIFIDAPVSDVALPRIPLGRAAQGSIWGEGGW